MSDIVHVIRATVSPSAAPTRAGQHWVNTTSGQMWLAVGTSSVADWVLAAGGSTAWDLNGNSGTNPSTDYIGTSDSVGFSIRTDGTEAIRVTSTQQIGIGTSTPILHIETKSHASTNSSGIAESTYYLETNDTSFNTAISLTLSDPTVAAVEFVAIARTSDGSGRAYFKRNGLFYREAGNVQIQGNWQSDVTLKSDNNFNVNYSMTTSTLNLRVKAPSSSNVRWTGYIKVQKIY